MTEKEQKIELVITNREVEESLIINDINPALIALLSNPSDIRTSCLFHYVGGKTDFSKSMRNIKKK